MFIFERTHFKLDENKIALRMDPDKNAGWETHFTSSLVTTMRKTFIEQLESNLNSYFKDTANSKIEEWVTESKGSYLDGTIGLIPPLLVENDIRIPESVYLDYELD